MKKYEAQDLVHALAFQIPQRFFKHCRPQKIYYASQAIVNEKKSDAKKKAVVQLYIFMFQMLSWDSETQTRCYSQITHRIAIEVILLFLETVLRTLLLLHHHEYILLHLKTHRDSEACSVPPSKWSGYPIPSFWMNHWIFPSKTVTNT